MTQDELIELLVANGLNPIQRGNNLMACCPFHPETNPSWGIHVDPPHVFGCFTCGEKGTLYRLLVHFGVSKAKAKQLADVEEDSQLKLPSFDKDQPWKPHKIVQSEFYPYRPTITMFSYLARRGVSAQVVTEADCAFDKKQQRILFPWYADKTIVGVTGRSIDPKEQVKTLPYFGTKKGDWLYLPSRKIDPSKPLILVEGEIDALAVKSAGFDNVAALGFGTYTKHQTDLTLNSGCRDVVLFFDQDDTGFALNRIADERLNGSLYIHSCDYTTIRRQYTDKLDPAALHRSELKKIIAQALNTVHFSRI
jgi:5S rRNA maturation endonuclease (ribonuclease M5)